MPPRYAARMRLQLHEDGRAWDVDVDGAIDVSMPIRFDADSGRAFHLGPARTAAVEGGGFVGDVRRGGSCNCETHTLTPHGDGTHTEGPGHVLAARLPVRVTTPLMLAGVVRVEPRARGASFDVGEGLHAPRGGLNARDEVHGELAGRCGQHTALGKPAGRRL
jgi:hypothetical protein